MLIADGLTPLHDVAILLQEASNLAYKHTNSIPNGMPKDFTEMTKLLFEVSKYVELVYVYGSEADMVKAKTALLLLQNKILTMYNQLN